MTDFKSHIKDINKDYTSLYFAMYMFDEYGVEVGYNPVSGYIINMQKQLAEWQLLSDCCTLCTMSAKPLPGTVTQLCSLPETPDPYSPFQPLFANGYSKLCNI